MAEDARKPLKPRENPDLLGHVKAERTLAAAARSGRLPHAWLIGGPPGVGKATLAFRFARWLLAGGAEAGAGLFGEEAEPDLYLSPDHPVFRRVASGGHADLKTVERPEPSEEDDKKASKDGKKKKKPKDLPVGEVRRVVPFLRLTPAEGGWRVVVVDDADTMNRSSANAILKILEEPPPRALILMVSSSPGALLPTIRSRCRKLSLEPLDENAVTEHLARVAPDLPEADLVALARLSEGSIGRAMGLMEDGGLALFRSLVDVLNSLPDLDRAAAHRLSEKLGAPAAEDAYRTFTDLLTWWTERLIRAHARGQAPAEVVGGEGALIARLSAAHGLDRWLGVWEKTRRLFARAETVNLDRRQTVLAALLTMAGANA
jgi:DNA polymerase-3 subunit delta'